MSAGSVGPRTHIEESGRDENRDSSIRGPLELNRITDSRRCGDEDNMDTAFGSRWSILLAFPILSRTTSKQTAPRAQARRGWPGETSRESWKGGSAARKPMRAPGAGTPEPAGECLNPLNHKL